MNAPTYTISTKTIDFVARIAEKLGEIRGAGEYYKFASSQNYRYIYRYKYR